VIAMIQVIEENSRLKKMTKTDAIAGTGAIAGTAGIGTSGLYHLGKVKKQKNQDVWDALHPTKSAKWVGNKIYPSLNPKNEEDSVIANIKSGANQIKKYYTTN